MAGKGFWVKLYPINPLTGLEEEFLFTTVNAPNGTQIESGKTYYPYLENYPSVAIGVFDGEFDGTSSVTIDELAISAENSIVQTFPNYVWDGARALVYRGDRDATSFASHLTKIFDGVVEGSPVVAEEVSSIRLVDKSYLLDVDLLTLSYAGTGGIEGPAAYAGVLKPLVVGYPLGVVPILVEAAFLTYQYSDYGKTGGVQSLWENGLSFGAATSTVAWQGSIAATYTALKAVSLTLGQWADAPSIGFFRLGGEPQEGGLITCDPAGILNVSSAVITTAKDVITYLVSLSPVAANINTSNFTTWQTAVGLDIADYFDSQVNIGQTIARYCAGAGGYYFFATSGLMCLGLIRIAGSASLTVRSDGTTSPLYESAKSVSVSAPYKTVRLGAQRCFRVHDQSEISDALIVAAHDWALVTGVGKPSNYANAGSVAMSVHQMFGNTLFDQVGDTGKPAGVRSQVSGVLNDAGVGWVGGLERSDLSVGVISGPTRAYTPMWRVNPKAKYRARFKVKASSNISTGFYSSFQELDSEPASSVLHIIMDGTPDGSTVVKSRELVTGGAVLHPTAPTAGVSFNNVALTTSYQMGILEVTPSPTAKFMNLQLVRWSGAGTETIHFESLVIEEILPTSLAELDATKEAEVVAATAAIVTISADTVLSRGEKPALITAYNDVVAKHASLQARATALGVTTEATTENTNYSALGTYLTGLSPAWNDATQNTTIVAATFQTKWNDVFTAQAALASALDAKAATLAAWGGVTGTGRPADYANAGSVAMNVHQMFGNPQFDLVGPTGAPAGMRATVSSAANDAGVDWVGGVQRSDLLIGGVAGNTRSYPPMWRVNPKAKYRARFKVKASADIGTGFYARFMELDSEPASGVAHIFYEAADATAVNATRERVTGGAVLHATTPTAGVSVENAALTTSYQMGVIEITPTSTAKFMGIQLLRWSGAGANTVHIESLVIEEILPASLIELDPAREAEVVAATAAIVTISADTVLSKGEKPALITKYNQASANHTNLQARATALGVTTEATTENTNWSALGTYLSGLSPLWNDATQDTTIVAATFQTKWNDVFTAQAALASALDAKAATQSTWAGVTGTGKPQDNADVTKNYAPGISGPASIDIHRTTMVPANIQEGRAYQFTRKEGNTDVTNSTTWGYSAPTGLTVFMSANKPGLLRVTVIGPNIPKESFILLSSTYGGVTYYFEVAVVLRNEFPESVVSTFHNRQRAILTTKLTSSTYSASDSAAVGGGVIQLKTDASGTATLSARLFFGLRYFGGTQDASATAHYEDIIDNDGGVMSIWAKWQYKINGGSFADAAAETESKTPYEVDFAFTEYLVPTDYFYYDSRMGYFENYVTLSGLTANSIYIFKLLARTDDNISGGTLPGIDVGGYLEVGIT